MKRSFLGIAVLAVILFLNIVFTQYMVHQFFYENYMNTLIFCGLNIVLFPIAFIAYKKLKKA